MTRTQGTIVIVMLGLIAFLSALPGVFRPLAPPPTWEYFLLTAPASGGGREGYSAGQPSTIKVPRATLDSLGDRGWELVGTLMEIETAYPNFGNSEYVTGLQPNIRPQLATLVFKRPRGVGRRLW